MSIQTNNKIKRISTLEGHTEAVWSVDFHPSGTLLASCGSDKTIKIWQKKILLSEGIYCMHDICIHSCMHNTCIFYLYNTYIQHTHICIYTYIFNTCILVHSIYTSLLHTIHTC